MKPFLTQLARPQWLAAALLCAALSACGGDSNDGTPGTGTNPGTGPDTTQPDQPGQPPANKPTLRCAP